jgi:hypothetical protein
MQGRNEDQIDLCTFFYFLILFQETCTYFFCPVLQKETDTVLQKDTGTCALDMVRPNSLWTSVYSCDWLEILLNICAFGMLPSVAYVVSMRVSMHACSPHTAAETCTICVETNMHAMDSCLHVAYMVTSTYAMHTGTHIQTG